MNTKSKRPSEPSYEHMRGVFMLGVVFVLGQICPCDMFYHNRKQDRIPVTDVTHIYSCYYIRLIKWQAGCMMCLCFA